MRAINSAFSRSSDSVALETDMLMQSMFRHFGDRPDETEHIVDVFFRGVGSNIPCNWRDISIESLLKENICEPVARHLML